MSNKDDPVVFLLFFYQCVWATDSLEKGYRGPVSTNLDVSPGQMVAAQQKSLLSKESVCRALGQKAVDDLGITDEIWERLQDERVAFDDPIKRNWIRQFKEKAKACNREFYHEMLELIDQNRTVHEERVKIAATAYFHSIFPSCDVVFQPKTGGVQLGARVIISKDGDQRYTYYIKTHSQGRLEEHSSPPELVKPEELFLYKFLELSGLGMECHFFGRDLLDIYIATLDAAFSNGRKGRFLTLNRYEGAQLARLTAGLSNFSYQENSQMEEILSENPVAQNFARCIVLTDLMSRIFRLSDLSTNHENFGFTFFDEFSEMCMKIIDFRIMPTRAMDDFRMTEATFGGFLSGNGDFNYSGHSKPYFLYILNGRDERLRFKFGLEVMRNFYRNKRFAEQACIEVSRYLSDPSNNFGDEQINLVRQLKSYKDAVVHNFDLMMHCFEVHEQKILEGAAGSNKAA